MGEGGGQKVFFSIFYLVFLFKKHKWFFDDIPFNCDIFVNFH